MLEAGTFDNGGADMDNGQTIAKEHQWEHKTSHDEDFWEERRCPVCGLEDRSERSAREKQWRVTTPCIEPVPERVAYADLCEELKKNDMREKALIILYPEYCTIGFLVGNQGIHLYPSIKKSGPEQIETACAELLRWIRARHYSVNRYSDFGYLNSLYSHNCDEDD